MENPFKQIYKFNKEAGLLEAGYNQLREPAFLIEEALEGFDSLDFLGAKIGMEQVYGLNAKEIHNPKEVSRWIVSTAMCGNGNYKESQWERKNKIEDVDLLDKHLDAIIYSAGSIFKLGLSPQQLEQALNIVMHANMKKLKNKVYDAEGKLMKDENFIPPEAALQELLNKIKH